MSTAFEFALRAIVEVDPATRGGQRMCATLLRVLLYRRRLQRIMLNPDVGPILLGPVLGVVVIAAGALCRVPAADFAEDACYTNGSVHVWIFTRRSGDRYVHVRSDHAAGWTTSFESSDAGRIGDQGVSVEVSEHRDAVVIDLHGVHRVLEPCGAHAAPLTHRRSSATAPTGPPGALDGPGGVGGNGLPESSSSNAQKPLTDMDFNAVERRSR